MPRYGFNDVSVSAMELLDRMRIQWRRSGSMWDVDVLDAKVIPVKEKNGTTTYYYLFEGAPFKMNTGEAMLRAVDEELREHWVNRFKEEESQFYGRKPPV